ncbi:hypothetical protein HAALTHF_31700n [Vreelandella aquamarina]|nr:hypothetical protein HAALTHF_31700n [Halomonas axialensis]
MGRWQEGALADARLALDVPELTLRKDVEYAVLRNIQASGQWLRDSEGGEAWLSGNAETVEWAQPEGVGDGPAATPLVSVTPAGAVGVANQCV